MKRESMNYTGLIDHYRDRLPFGPEVRAISLGDYDMADLAYELNVAAAALAQIAQQHRRGVDVVDRDVEEALDLVGVQVHHHHALDAHGGEHVGHHLRRDRHARRAWTAIPRSWARRWC